MRRLGLILLVMVALTFSVKAEGAPERIQTELTSPTGRTVIRFDAEVRVPEVEAMSVIPVESVAFDSNKVAALAELMWPGLDMPVEESHYQGQGFRGHTMGVFASELGGEDVEVSAGASWKDQLKGMEGICDSGLHGAVKWGHRAFDGQTVNYSQMPLDEEVIGEGIPGHPLTSAQAAKVAEDFLRQLTNEPFASFLVGQGQGGVFSDEPVPGPQPENSYVVVLTRVVDGVPLLPSLFQDMATWSTADLFAPPVGYERVTVNLDRAGRVVDFQWKNPWQPVGEPVPQTLLPFEDILAVAEQMLPLKYLWLEPFTDQLVIDVTRVELGYMALLQQDKRTFALTPVWVFYGDGEMLPSYQDVLTVSAVDGRVIDMEMGY